jgi:hypothetical protein
MGTREIFHTIKLLDNFEGHLALEFVEFVGLTSRYPDVQYIGYQTGRFIAI